MSYLRMQTSRSPREFRETITAARVRYMQVKNLCQAGNQDELGVGPRTISQSGCMLTCWAMAVNTLRGNRMTPSTLNDFLKGAGAFVGSGLVVDKVCRALHLKCSRRNAVVEDVFEAIDAQETLVMLGVDYKPGASSGFSDADHFVLAYATGQTAGQKSTRTIIAADPATGHDVSFAVESGRLVSRPSERSVWPAAEALYITSAAS